MINILKKRKTKYVFNFIALMVLFGSISIYSLFNQTNIMIKKTDMESHLLYIDNITSNISEHILKKTSSNIYQTLKSDKHIREDLDLNLQLLITQRYRYIYVVNRSKNGFQFLLDGSINQDDKSEFEEEFTPLNTKKWNEVYTIKKALYFKHKDIENVWLTYLKPIVVNGEVQAIIAIDFSLEDHKSIKESLDKLDRELEIAILFSIFIFIIIVRFSFLDHQRIKDLKEKTYEIRKLNDTLQLRIAQEVEKNREKDKQILQQSRLAQLGEMISMIAHQWRQPLSAIGSTSSAIQLKAQLHKLDEKEIITLSKNISKYVRHLSSTIDDFRDFFKSNKIKGDITYNQLISGVLGIIEASISNKNITLIQELNSTEIFHTFANELKQVILNLLKNAEDVLIENQIKNPKIYIKSYDNILEVSDNAGGVPADILEKIFDPYFSTKAEKNGTGLGLYMSKTIIEEHCNGTLSVHNNDEGAVFTIKL